MTGQKKQPDRVVSQLSLWENLDALGDALGVDLPPLENDVAGMSSRLSQLDAQLQHAATHAASDALPPRVASLYDNTATQKDYAERIIKLLEKVCYSRNAYSVFYDWTSLVEAALDMLPAHLASAARHGRLAEDTPEVARLFERLRASYRPADFEVFAQAFALLLESTEWGYMDVLGEVFMLFTHPNPRLGQYFTPWPVSSLLAELAVPSGERDVHERLKEAISKSPLAEAALLAGTLFREEEADEAFHWFITRIVPAALPSYRAITLCDPCIGSGRMMLAAAARFPKWAVLGGLVRFYGSDVDELMCRIARLNFHLYGLNGTGLRYARALAPDAADVLRDDYQLTDDPARVKTSVIHSDQTPTPEQVMEQVTLLDGSAGPGEADRVAPDARDEKSCSVCGVSPQEKPGTWYVIDDRIYCRECAASHCEQPAGEWVEVTYG